MTECSCPKCIAACKHMPGMLAPEDLGNLPISQLRASDGAVVMTRTGIARIGTIVPEQKPDGSCVFLVDGRCSVHDVKPYGCREFDVCDEDAAASTKRSATVLYQILQSADYAKVRADLPHVGRTAWERRAALQEELDQIDREEANVVT